MRFLVVTPSFNQRDFLRRCVASVKRALGSGHQALDSGGGAGTPISVHHHVQDAGSEDGTVEWLKTAEEGGVPTAQCSLPNAHHPTPGAYSLSYASEQDAGMYDAVSRGWHLADADTEVVAYLNCDEQYLPDALERVADYFKKHPAVDVLCGDVIVGDVDGNYVCSRRMTRAGRNLILSDHLPYFTAAMFIRREALEKYALYPDKRWKNIGDVELVLRMMECGVRIGRLHEYTSVFCETGTNFGLDELAAKEYAELRANAPKWVCRLRGLWVMIHRVKKLLSGGYHLAPFGYEVYTGEERKTVLVDKPEARWLSRQERT
jgi:glycosyltransferase involved in cell wall biosynthesis